MSDQEQKSVERLQAILTALLKRQLAESLGDVEKAIKGWRDEELGVFEAHAELLKHAARAERLAERMARIGLDSAATLMRDAFDAGLVDREEFVELIGQEPAEIDPSPPVAEGQGGGLPDKRELVEDLLSAGPVLVHIDARRRDVSIPERFRDDPRLVLRFGYGLNPAIIDLSVDDEHLSGTLTFGGVPHRCMLPWAAVYAVVSEVDHKGMVWPDDVPECVVDTVTSAEPPADKAPPEPTKKRGSHLKLVK